MTSNDFNDMEDMKRAMAEATPTPDAARKADTMARSMEIFAAAQGSQEAARQSSETRTPRGFFKGAFDMLISKTTGALTATTALVAVGFLFLSPQGQQMLQGPVPGVVTGIAPTMGGDEAFDQAEDTFPVAPRVLQEPFVVEAPTSEAVTVLDTMPEAPAPTTPPAELGGLIIQGFGADSVGSLTTGDTDGARDFAPTSEAEATPLRQAEGGLANAGSPEAGVFNDHEALGEFTSDIDITFTLTGETDQGVQFGARVDLDESALSNAANAVPRVISGDFGTLTMGDTGSGFNAVAPFTPLTEEFANADANPLQIVAEDPVSTFSIDVDTASYALLRSTLNRGQLPAPDAVRIEEMVNYFPYDYPAPTADDISPFRPTVQVFQTPWNPDTQLLHIGIQGEMPVLEDRPPLNLVFLIDTSGSMNDPAKLPLLIQSFRLMLDRLNPEDEVAIVTYAGSAGVALEPTAASDTATISAALTALQAGGGTNGVGGLEEAYRLAAEMTEDGDVSRVLLATDGDFNVGLSEPGALEEYIADQRETGIYLSVLGFGRGNLQDDTMQALAQNGNGTAAYIDTLHEAQRVLVDQMAGALFPIADDLKVQVEFNPDVIAEYRLIGYETRALAREDFANDAVDAGDIGAGHTVTAIYEVTPVGSPATLVAPLRYAADDGETTEPFTDELGFISLRWKEPGAEESQLVDFPIANAVAEAGTDAQFAAAIAGFGQLLRGSDFLGDWNYGDAIALANANRGADEFGYRTEAVQLMRLAESLAAQ